ncbi:LOW QUALITY PROTEIN: testis-expressed protein 9 [Silurus meridionalis]|uniref:LOW QUALITY PROTEIN: testis-expressed protein 9 n=1 Tax=Silurus meridionalis TaxID=175797 RepID=UPI001EEB3749|nr:LOW QUALITY PROTEIN: testis-expressed protein 9 [Silurus meridionalis]
MADRPRPVSQGAKKPQSAASQRPSSATRPTNRPASAPTKKSAQMDLLAKEEEYKRLNAELEAKTAELVRQAEEVMREQNEVLSKPISTNLNLDSEEFSNVPMPAVKQSTAKAVKEKMHVKAGKLTRPPSTPRKTAQEKETNVVDDVAVVEDFTDFSLAKTISKIEDGVNDDATGEQLEDDVMPSTGVEMGAEVQIRFLKAKLRVVQEELNRLSHECNKKDEENGVLSSKLKEVEEDRVRLQRMSSLQQTQLEKHRALAEDANRNCDSLRQQVTALQKEVEGIKRAQKQASSSHNATEVRLNRALEEAERSKAELVKLKQSSKDSVNQEQQRIEALQAENKRLEKQKDELITGFKKQLKLIDILKRQKIHFEAARMMSFTEEEFMKALDWGKM